MSTIKPLVYDAANARLAEIEIQSPIGKNLLINSDMQINQRGFAGGALAAGVYGYDRWKAGTGGCNVSVDSGGLFTHNSGPLVQIIEAPNGVFGKNVTFSVEDPTGTISVSVGGVIGAITAGGGRRGVTLSIPSGSGNLTVQITAAGVTYRRPQLERGDGASQFEYRLQAHELLLCQRYFEKSYQQDIAPGTASDFGRYSFGTNGVLSADTFVSVPFKVPKRSQPAIVIYSVSSTPVAGRVGQDDGSSVVGTVNIVGANAFQVNWKNSTGRWGGFFHFVADAEL